MFNSLFLYDSPENLPDYINSPMTHNSVNLTKRQRKTRKRRRSMQRKSRKINRHH